MTEFEKQLTLYNYQNLFETERDPINKLNSGDIEVLLKLYNEGYIHQELGILRHSGILYIDSYNMELLKVKWREIKIESIIS